MRHRRPAALLGALLAVGISLPATAAAPVSKTWAGEQIRLYNAFTNGLTGRGVTVAVLDSWIDTTHPDLRGRVVGAADCTSGTCRTSVVKDSCGQHHGTHVAGTAVSSSYGVAPGASLLAVKVLNGDGSGDCAGDPDNVAAGIRWAVARGADVLNLSLGPDVPGQGSTGPLPAAVRDAAAAGVVVVFSAGNQELPVAQSYGDDALVVAATNRAGGLADYTQREQGVSVAAPGGEADSAERCDQSRCITSLYPGSQYAVAAGTSMAAPHVAGLAALLIQQHPTWTRAQVVNRIRSTANPLAGAGSGLVDVTAALAVRPRATTTSPRPRATKPAARPAPRPTRAPARAAATPSPVAIVPVRPAPTAPPSLVPAPTATTAPPVLAAPDPAGDQVPVVLAGIAGALVGLAGFSVLALRPVRR